jgi:hypothetical protein
VKRRKYFKLKNKEDSEETYNPEISNLHCTLMIQDNKLVDAEPTFNIISSNIPDYMSLEGNFII